MRLEHPHDHTAHDETANHFRVPCFRTAQNGCAASARFLIRASALSDWHWKNNSGVDDHGACEPRHNRMVQSRRASVFTEVSMGPRARSVYSAVPRPASRM